jgi:hypothetical protein
MAHPAESTHWYDKQGKPAYEVPAAKGGMRPTTLRDARKLGLVPSVTSIIRQAAAPGLERWKQLNVLHAALTLPIIQGEPEEQYLNRIMRDSQEEGKKASERGTVIHTALEGNDFTGPYGKHVQSTNDAMIEWLGGQQEWVNEASFAHPLGFGGKCDSYCPLAVIDYKTTEKDLETIKTWDEHALQLASYRQGLHLPAARCAIVYVHIDGPAKVIEIEEEALARGWEMFKALLDYFYAKTGLAR